MRLKASPLAAAAFVSGLLSACAHERAGRRIAEQKLAAKPSPEQKECADGSFVPMAEACPVPLTEKTSLADPIQTIVCFDHGDANAWG